MNNINIWEAKPSDGSRSVASLFYLLVRGVCVWSSIILMISCAHLHDKISKLRSKDSFERILEITYFICILTYSF